MNVSPVHTRYEGFGPDTLIRCLGVGVERAGAETLELPLSSWRPCGFERVDPWRPFPLGQPRCVCCGALAYSEGLTVAGFLTRWLEDSCRASVRPTTFECYERVVRLRVAPYLGPLRLDGLRPAHIQGLYAELGRRGDSPRMRQLVHAVLHRAFVQAERRELIARNPCDAVDRPRVPRREVPILNPDEVQQLLEAARGGRLEALYTLAVATGARQGELL